MVSERDAKGAASPVEASPPFRCLQPRRATIGLAYPSRPRAIPAQFSQSPMGSMRRTKLPFRPRGPELGPGTARQRPAMLRSSCVPACRRLVLSNRALPPLRASRRGVRYSKCYASGAMSRGTRKAAIEPASRRAERLDPACSSTPASAALETMSRVALRVRPDGRAPSGRGKAKGGPQSTH